MASLVVTGGLGFIASNFLHHIIESRPELTIRNVDYQGVGSNPANVEDLKSNKNYTFVKADLSQSDTALQVLEGADYVVNFAAETHVDRSISNPNIFFESNARASFNLFESARKNNVKKLVHISTDEVYGSTRSGSFDEGSPLNPSSPYSATKAAADLMAQAWNTTYDLNVVVVRCTNNFGPYQHPEKFIPKTIIRALNGREVPLYGGGSQVRDWIFVRDFCLGIEKALNSGESGTVYNFSAGNELTNREVAEKIMTQLDKPNSLIVSTEDRPGHDFRYSLSSEKARSKLGWKPRHTFDEALGLTVKWYLNHKQWWKPLASEKVLSETPWKEKW